MEIFHKSGGRVHNIVEWFNERLSHERYGEVRGSGVLVRDEIWKVAQYNLSFPIPNGIAEDVVAMIKGMDDDAQQE